MKKLIALICLLYMNDSIFAQQKAEIVLVGVFHEIPDSLKCNWEKTYQKLERYQPDQMAVEYNAPTDTASQMYYLGKDYLQVWDSVMLVGEGKKVNAQDSITKYFGLLSKKENAKHRLQLWRYYHLHTDMGNRDYQTYLIENEWNTYWKILDTTRVWDKFFFTRQKATVKSRKNGEFFNLVFPLAKKYNITYLFPTDDKITYSAQSEAYGNFAEALEKTEDWKKYEAFWQEFIATEEQEKAKCSAIEFANSQMWLDKTDYGQTRILAHHNNPDYVDYVRVWYKRNESIAHRIIDAVVKSKAKKMVVFYGYMHIFPVKMYLEKLGYRVKLIGDLQ